MAKKIASIFAVVIILVAIIVCFIYWPRYSSVGVIVLVLGFLFWKFQNWNLVWLVPLLLMIAGGIWFYPTIKAKYFAQKVEEKRSKKTMPDSTKTAKQSQTPVFIPKQKTFVEIMEDSMKSMAASLKADEKNLTEVERKKRKAYNDSIGISMKFCHFSDSVDAQRSGMNDRVQATLDKEIPKKDFRCGNKDTRTTTTDKPTGKGSKNHGLSKVAKIQKSKAKFVPAKMIDPTSRPVPFLYQGTQHKKSPERKESGNEERNRKKSQRSDRSALYFA